MFTAALFTIAKIRKEPQCPSIDERIKKMWYVCVHTYTHHTLEYYSAIKRMQSCHLQQHGWT